MQYGVGRQPCRCAQINSLLEVSHAVSMQSTVSRLLQLKIYRTSTRSRCTCTRVHVQYKTRYEVYIRVQYFMYSANKKENPYKNRYRYTKRRTKMKGQSTAKDLPPEGVCWGRQILLLTTKGNTTVMGLGSLLAQWLTPMATIIPRPSREM